MPAHYLNRLGVYCAYLAIIAGIVGAVALILGA